jgi:hypothetical protein
MVGSRTGIQSRNLGLFAERAMAGAGHAEGWLR